MKIFNKIMEFKLDTGNGCQLIGDIYNSGAEPSRVILLIHGLGEHFGRYSHWASWFAEEGTAVIGVDLPGHGRSPGRRGHINSYHTYNSIIDSLAKFAVKSYGDKPIGLYGHSLGGNIVLNYLLTNSSGFDFAVATSSWLELVSAPSDFAMGLAKVVNRIFPTILQANGLKLEHISRADDVNEKYNSDPLVHDRVSVRLAVEATNAAERILETGSLIDIPVLLVHGEDDKITSKEGSKKLAGINNKLSLKIWDKGYHELHNETFNRDVFNYINSWIVSL